MRLQDVRWDVAKYRCFVGGYLLEVFSLVDEPKWIWNVWCEPKLWRHVGSGTEHTWKKAMIAAENRLKELEKNEIE